MRRSRYIIRKHKMIRAQAQQQDLAEKGNAAAADSEKVAANNNTPLRPAA